MMPMCVCALGHSVSVLLTPARPALCDCLAALHSDRSAWAVPLLQGQQTETHARAQSQTSPFDLNCSVSTFQHWTPLRCNELVLSGTRMCYWL